MSLASTQIANGSSKRGVCRIRVDVRSAFRLGNVLSQASDQTNNLLCDNWSINGAATWAKSTKPPIECDETQELTQSSFSSGRLELHNVLHLGLQRPDTTSSKQWPRYTTVECANSHLGRLMVRFASDSLESRAPNLLMWSSHESEKTIKPSTYTLTPVKPLTTLFAILWNMLPLFFIPKGITRYS